MSSTVWPAANFLRIHIRKSHSLSVSFLMPIRGGKNFFCVCTRLQSGSMTVAYTSIDDTAIYSSPSAPSVAGAGRSTISSTKRAPRLELAANSISGVTCTTTNSALSHGGAGTRRGTWRHAGMRHAVDAANR